MGIGCYNASELALLFATFLRMDGRFTVSSVAQYKEESMICKALTSSVFPRKDKQNQSKPYHLCSVSPGKTKSHR